jgi:hypothetical protein
LLVFISASRPGRGGNEKKTRKPNLFYVACIRTVKSVRRLQWAGIGYGRQEMSTKFGGGTYRKTAIW